MDIYENFIKYNKMPPRLPAEEEKEIFARYCQTRNDADREKLIVHNLRLVKEVVFREYYATQFETEELFSIGVFGLIKAVENFDPAKECTFSTLAYICIRNEIGHLITTSNYAKRKGAPLSIDTTVIGDTAGTDGDAICLIDSLVDEEETIEEKVVDKMFKKETLEQINQILQNEGERKTRIFSKYWGINGYKRKTFREIAQEEGLTYQRVEQIIKKIMRRIRGKFGVKEHEDFNTEI